MGCHLSYASDSAYIFGASFCSLRNKEVQKQRLSMPNEIPIAADCPVRYAIRNMETDHHSSGHDTGPVVGFFLLGPLVG